MKFLIWVIWFLAAVKVQDSFKDTAYASPPKETNYFSFVSTNLFWTNYFSESYLINYLSGTTNSLAPRADKDIEETVRLMAKEGYICKVFGHTWELGCGVKGCAVYHEVIYHCKFCAKTKELKWEIKE
jgi:hypothetical protein